MLCQCQIVPFQFQLGELKLSTTDSIRRERWYRSLGLRVAFLFWHLVAGYVPAGSGRTERRYRLIGRSWGEDRRSQCPCDSTYM